DTDLADWAPMPIEPEISVLFVCLGNHCRSPAAHAIARDVLTRRAVRGVRIDSAGTSAAHRGDDPQPMAMLEGRRRGYSLDHVGRMIHPDDFAAFDLIVAMDRQNIDDLRRLGGGLDQRISRWREVEPDQLQLVR